MARNINRALISGNLTRDPDQRTTPGGLEVAEFSVAVNGAEKRGDEWQERVEFVDVVAFGQNARFIGEFGAKGKPVVIDARLRQERWEKDGQKRSKLILVADRIQLTGGRDSGGLRERPPASYDDAGAGDLGGAAPGEFEAPAPQEFEPQTAGARGASEDDIPF